MVDNASKLYGLYHSSENEDRYLELYASSSSLEEICKLADATDLENAPSAAEIDSKWEEALNDQHSESDVLIDTTKDSPFGEQIWAGFNEIYSYYDLLIYFTDIIPKLGRQLFAKNVIGFADEHFSVVEERNGLKIYALDQTDDVRITRNIDRVKRFHATGSKIRSSILLSLVSTFDAVFVDFCKFLMREMPQKYEGSDKKYTVQEILSLNSLDDIVNKVINDELEQLMAGSHLDQMVFFENNFHVDFIKNFTRWPNYIELFERRNLAAHGNLVVNSFYIEKCSKAGLQDCPSLGTKLKIDRQYMKESVDLLLEVYLLLAFQVWRKRSPESSPDAFSLVVNLTFEMLKDGHPQLAVNIARFALSIKDKNCDAITRNMIAINCAIGLKATSQEDEAMSLLDSIDWSGTSSLFKLCVGSLRGDAEEAARHLKAVEAAGEMDIVFLREWPVFQWVRTNTAFKAEVERVFSEPISKTSGSLIEEHKAHDDDES